MADKRSTLRLTAAVVIVGVAVAAYMLRPAANADTAHADVAPVAESVALPRMLDLGADKCVPCKMMAPILEELRVEQAGRLEVVFIDVWKNKEEAAKYNIDLIPTQIFYAADGRELFRHEGFYAKEEILAKWKEFGVALKGS